MSSWRPSKNEISQKYLSGIKSKQVKKSEKSDNKKSSSGLKFRAGTLRFSDQVSTRLLFLLSSKSTNYSHCAQAYFCPLDKIGKKRNCHTWLLMAGGLLEQGITPSWFGQKPPDLDVATDTSRWGTAPVYVVLEV